MKIINYFFFRFFVFGFKFVPFWMIYRLSNFIAFLLHRVLRYRYQVIKENLDLIKDSIYSDKIGPDIREIYRNLADIMLESIKGFSMSKDTLQKRHKWVNPEILEDTFKQQKSVILVTGHFNNWEWGAFSPNYFLKHKIIGLYKPLTNEYINRYMLRKRASSGTVLANINDTSQYFKNYHDKNAIFLMAADQSPTKPELAIWTTFLGVETPCLHGIEKYYQQYKLPVIYCDIQRVDRGYYAISLEWVHEDISIEVEKGEITKSFMKKLEKRIEINPESWLWSHRRWKHADRAFERRNAILSD